MRYLFEYSVGMNMSYMSHTEICTLTEVSFMEIKCKSILNHSLKKKTYSPSLRVSGSCRQDSFMHSFSAISAFKRLKLRRKYQVRSRSYFNNIQNRVLSNATFVRHYKAEFRFQHCKAYHSMKLSCLQLPETRREGK